MRIFFVLALLLGLAACGQPLYFEQEPDGGIGGTGVIASEMLLE